MKIFLRAVEPEDLELLAEIDNDSTQWELSAQTAPISLAQLRQYINTYTADPYRDGQVRFVITASPESDAENPSPSCQNPSSSSQNLSPSAEIPSAVSGNHFEKVSSFSSEKCRPVGLIDLYEVDAIHQRAFIGIFILEKERGKGIATATLKLIERYAYKVLGLHQLAARVNEDNLTSQALFRSAGYDHIGTLRDWYRRSRSFVTMLLFSKILG